MSTALKIIPTGECTARAEIADVDLTQSLTREQVEQVRAALLDYGVVFFRNQHISEPDQVRFTGYFGRP